MKTYIHLSENSILIKGMHISKIHFISFKIMQFFVFKDQPIYQIETKGEINVDMI